MVSREPRIPYLINRKTRLKPGEQNEKIVRAPPNFQGSKRLRSRQVAPRHGGKLLKALQNGGRGGLPKGMKAAGARCSMFRSGASMDGLQGTPKASAASRKRGFMKTENAVSFAKPR